MGKENKTMKTFKFGDRELNVKFAYEPTLKSHILSKMAKMEKGVGTDEENVDMIENLMLMIPEILLVGLQKFHKDEFGYDYDSEDGKDAKMSEVFKLMDEYFDEEGADLMELYQGLEEELMKDSFLSSLFNQEKAKAKKATRK
jgi:hypothetical protein